jgi:hypothetical protein
VVDALVMIVDRNREDALRVVLADHIIVENIADFLRGRNAVTRLHIRVLVLLADDVHAKLDAFIANENGRPCNELTDFVLALAAEGAVERVLGVVTPAFFRH